MRGAGRVVLGSVVRPDIGDAAAIAALHVQAWAETYAGLLPAAEIARYDDGVRRAQWARALGGASDKGGGRIVWVREAGFAMMGPQRDKDLAALWPDELYALYLLRACQGLGLGRAMLAAVQGGPFTATVVAGNLRAERFYAAAGGVELARRVEDSMGMRVTEVVLGFAP